MLKKLFTLLFLIAFLDGNAQCFTTVASSNYTIIARKSDGTLWAIGRNQYGTAGNGTAALVSQLTQIGSDSDWTNSISMSFFCAFAIKSDGTLWTWGIKEPQMGIGPLNDNNIIMPTQVGTDSDWKKVGAGINYTIAIKEDGTLWSWGSNQEGALGTNNLDDNFISYVPMQVGTNANWSNVYANGEGHISLAIKENGTLWSWGTPSPYLLGYPNSHLNNSYRSPHQIGTDTDWMQVSVSNQFSAALKNNGTLFAWGTTSTSLFGNGLPQYTTFNSPLPVQIGTDSDWTQFTVGHASLLALKSNGTRWGWGQNSSYQLGAGSNTFISTPTQLDTDSDWLYLHNDSLLGAAQGIRQDNSLYCWGFYYHLSTALPVPALVGSLCSLSTNDFNEKNIIKTYPNPVEDVVTILLNEYNIDKINVRVLNNLGQIVFEVKNIEINNLNEFQLDLRNLKSGLYFLNINNDNEKVKYLYKIIKK
jgi:alpha-tubulin suppressor-like RCC1 family protein